MTKPKVLAPHTYNYLPVGHPDNPKTYAVCGAPTRQVTAKYRYCTRPAGWGTSHAGAGRCKLHGGVSQVGPANPNWRGGRKSYIYRERLTAQIRQSLDAASVDPLDLTAELETQRTILLLALDDLLNDKNSQRAQKGDRGGVADKHGSEIITAAIPPSQSVVITPEKVQLVRDLSNDIVNTVIKVIASKNQTAFAKAELLFISAAFKEAIERFVEPEQRKPMVKFMQDKLHGLYKQGSDVLEIDE